MIQRKIEQVDERDRKLLLVASIQGYEFDSAVVAEAIEMDPAEVEERLDVLERVHVFVRRGEESEFPDRSLTLNYQFVHVLYQNALDRFIAADATCSAQRTRGTRTRRPASRSGRQRGCASGRSV